MRNAKRQDGDYSIYQTSETLLRVFRAGNSIFMTQRNRPFRGLEKEKEGMLLIVYRGRGPFMSNRGGSRARLDGIDDDTHDLRTHYKYY